MPNTTPKAFTLIELMIVVAIIGIMSSVVIISMQNGKIEKELETAAREVAATIREAQNNALTGKNASSTNPICSQYNFAYTNGSSNYSVNCSGNYSNNYTLKNGVTFASGGNFNFSIPFGGVAANGIKITKNSICYCVAVNSSGSVEEKGRLANCSTSCP